MKPSKEEQLQITSQNYDQIIVGVLGNETYQKVKPLADKKDKHVYYGEMLAARDRGLSSFEQQVDSRFEVIKTTSEYTSATTAEDFLNSVILEVKQAVAEGKPVPEAFQDISWKTVANLVSGEGSFQEIMGHKLDVKFNSGFNRRVTMPTGGEEIYLKNPNSIDPALRKELAARLMAINQTLASSENYKSISQKEANFIVSIVEGKPDPELGVNIIDPQSLGKGILEMWAADTLIQQAAEHTLKTIVLSNKQYTEPQYSEALKKGYYRNLLSEFHLNPDQRHNMAWHHYDFVDTTTHGEAPTFIETVSRHIIDSSAKK